MIRIETGNKLTEYRTERLDRYTRAYRIYRTRQDLKKAALCIYTIYKEKLYLERGYKNVYEFGTKGLGSNRGTISNMIQVSRKFLNADTGMSIFMKDDVDFSFSQLVELRYLDADTIKDLMSTGQLTYDTTVKNIIEMVKDIKKKNKEEKEEAKKKEMQPIIDAYDKFNESFNILYDRAPDDETRDLLQSIMNNVVLIYNSNKQFWK